MQFCTNCGTPVQANGYSQPYQQPPYQQNPYQQYGQFAPVRPIGFGEAVRNFFTQYATFDGRATRSEYWYVFLFNMIVNAVIGILMAILPTVGAILSSLYMLATLVPTLALCWRRLHDFGKSGVYYLMGLIPLAGSIILIVYFCTDSGPDNQYGRRKV